MRPGDRQAMPSQVLDSFITREEVVAEAEDDREVEWYDYAVKRTGPFTRRDWDYSRWCWRATVDLLPHQRAEFFKLEHAQRTAAHRERDRVSRSREQQEVITWDC